MTGFILALAIALVCAGALLPFVPRPGRGLVLAALALGLAGYAAQGSPWLPGSPTRPVADRGHPPAISPAERQKWTDELGEDGRWLILADSYSRDGDARGAAEIIRSGLGQHPNSALLWLAFGNALVADGDGLVTPAAELAFARAHALDPANPAPPLFHAMALAQAGRLGDADAIMSALIARTPPDAPWRADLAQRLQALRTLEGK